MPGSVVAFDAYKKAKLAAIFSLVHLPDRAAKVLLIFGSELAPIMDVTRGLDLLAMQADGLDQSLSSYQAVSGRPSVEGAFPLSGNREGTLGGLTPLAGSAFAVTDPVHAGIRS